MSDLNARWTDDKPNASSSKKRKTADTDSISDSLSDTDGTSSDELSDPQITPAHTLRSRVASHSPEQNAEHTPQARAPLPAPGLQSAQQLRQPAADAAAVNEELQAPAATAAAIIPSALHARVKPEPYDGHINQAVHISQLQLDNCIDICAPATQWQLQTDVQPDSQLSATWRSGHMEPQLYSLQLIPDAQEPRIRVGVEPAMLKTYSLWARTCSPIDVVLSPLRVSQNTLYTLIHSLYSGFLDMSCDVEELLMLAKHLQVSVVEQVCLKYLLSLNLEPTQLLHMASLLNTLSKPAAYKQSLQKLFEMPWKTEQVMAVIAQACNNLLDQGTVGVQLCWELLHSTKRGALCEMQVLSVLRSAGLKLEDPVLATLFQPAVLNDRCMEVLEPAINLQAEDAPSPQLLYALLQRHEPFRSQADLSPEKVVVVPFCALRTKCSKHEEAPMAIALTRKTTDGVAAVADDPQLFIKYMKQASKHETGMTLNGQVEAFVLYTVHSSQPHVRVLAARSSVQPGSMTSAGGGAYNTLLQLAKQDSSFCVGLWAKQHAAGVAYN